MTKAVARPKHAGLAIARLYCGIFLAEAGALIAVRKQRRHGKAVDQRVELGQSKYSAELDAEGAVY